MRAKKHVKQLNCYFNTQTTGAHSLRLRYTGNSYSSKSVLCTTKSLCLCFSLSFPLCPSSFLVHFVHLLERIPFKPGNMWTASLDGNNWENSNSSCCCCCCSANATQTQSHIHSQSQPVSLCDHQSLSLSL